MIKGRTGKFLVHSIGWVLFLCLPLLFNAGHNFDYSSLIILISPLYWLFMLSYAFLFYSHTYYVFPEWYLKKKYTLYVFYIGLFLTLIVFLKPFDHLVGLVNRHDQSSVMSAEENRFHEPPPGPPPNEEGDRDRRFPGRPWRGPGREMHVDIISIILYFLTLALSIAVITSRQLRFSQERALQAETEKAQAELSVLKAQINPHFLFNTLNNIYSLAVSNHENTANSILKLSNILRYVTEDVTHHFVPLEKEISCIKDYIDLQQLRLSNKTTIEFSVEGIYENVVVAPMIFMTYIENAFKFGISSHEQSVITISIAVNERSIDFFCQNQQFATARNAESTGIGLSNTHRRLDHLYKSNYQLQTGVINGKYTVQLHIHHLQPGKNISNGD
jgi:two-component system LytT family sensor kinase